MIIPLLHSFRGSTTLSKRYAKPRVNTNTRLNIEGCKYLSHQIEHLNEGKNYPFWENLSDLKIIKTATSELGLPHCIKHIYCYKIFELEILPQSYELGPIDKAVLLKF